MSLSCFFCQSRFWWSLLVGVDWWDAVGCTQSAAEDEIGKIRVNCQILYSNYKIELLTFVSSMFISLTTKFNTIENVPWILALGFPVRNIKDLHINRIFI